MSQGDGWPKAIFYDSKNTLFDWSKLWVQASREIVSHYGGDVDGAAFKDLWHRLLIAENHRTAFARYREFTVALEDSLIYTCRYFGIPGRAEDVKFMLDLWDAVEPFPDTVAALTDQQALTRVLIFSNVETRYLEMMASKMAGFTPDFMGSMQQAQCCKPSPRAYRWVLEQNGLTAEDVVYCAGPPWDAQGAHAFGMKTIWLNRTGVEPDGVPVDYTVSDLHGVTDIVAARPN
ncbi:MAG: HAD hydrolase-like protein [Alphaproteobacteria bacterium]|nr:HAD hydrolase-like protein [Alphaproteobacteria bacterium]MDP6566853.1 HAD hydrolase-like protein [Alphaproteobacteria bacterium]MDP6813453.1 HAD hydrolase-like protein [Alphaproteobacteria bacterium]